MRRAIGGIIIILIVVAIIAAVDVANTPTASTGQCLLARRTVLPDICVSSCQSGGAFDCTRTTRPYLIFFTQAASCLDAVIC